MPLEARNISFRYDRKEPYILENVSLSVERGERVALFAPSGYGKTTLVKLMSGYLEPTEGQILLDGKPSSVRPHPSGLSTMQERNQTHNFV